MDILTLGTMGVYPCCYELVDVNLCLVLVTDDNDSFSVVPIISSELFLFPALLLPLEIDMDFPCLEQSDPLLTLCHLFEIRQEEIDRKCFAHLHTAAVQFFFSVHHTGVKDQEFSCLLCSENFPAGFCSLVWQNFYLI